MCLILAVIQLDVGYDPVVLACHGLMTAAEGCEDLVWRPLQTGAQRAESVLDAATVQDVNNLRNLCAEADFSQGTNAEFGKHG
jgi:hypothetical protein